MHTVSILEDLVTILIILGSPSHVHLFPHHNNLWPVHWHRHINTPLPLKLGLGVEELGLEGRNNFGIVRTPNA